MKQSILDHHFAEKWRNFRLRVKHLDAPEECFLCEELILVHVVLEVILDGKGSPCCVKCLAKKQ